MGGARSARPRGHVPLVVVAAVVSQHPSRDLGDAPASAWSTRPSNGVPGFSGYRWSGRGFRGDELVRAQYRVAAPDEVDVAVHDAVDRAAADDGRREPVVRARARRGPRRR